MKKVFSSKKITGALAAIMAVALLLGGTFAWRDISQNAQNVFTASSYEAELVDIFTPPSNWEKDETINKDVYVKNTGSGDIFVRVNFDDILKLKGESDQAQKPYTGFTVNGDGTASTTSFNKFEWAMGSGLIYDMADWNGCTDAWFYDTTTGWFYWGNVLTSGTQTDKLLDAVKLLTDVDKDFEYIINVNMHAFSADSKGIEDLEDTDGTIAPAIKDMVNGIVSKSEAAAKDKAFEERVKQVYGDPLPSDKEIKTEADGTKHIIDKATGDYILDRVNFPDEIFYEYVKQFDTDNDGKLSQAEVNAVTIINISGGKGNHSKLKDYTGVEIFTKIKRLYAQYANLNSLDVSGLSELEIIGVQYNPLSEIKGLDSASSNLYHLNIASTKISQCDTSSMAALKAFIATNTPISTVDFSNNSLLTQIGLTNTFVQSIDLSFCPDLNLMEIMGTEISQLDISSNPNFKRLFITDSNITSIDLKNIAFEHLGVSSTQQIINLNTSALVHLRSTDDNGRLQLEGANITESAGFFQTNTDVKYELAQNTANVWDADDIYRYGKAEAFWIFPMEQQEIGNQQVYMTKEGMAIAIGGTQNGNVIDLAAGDQVVTVKGIYTLTSAGTLAADGTVTAASADWTPLDTVSGMQPFYPAKTLAEASGTTVAASVVGGELTNHK